MREVHYCDVCDFRLPYCVRTDRRFCSSRCRVWWQRHPGIKRLYGWRGRVRLPQPPKQGQPKTFAAALIALAESRKYAAQLEATAKAQKSAEQNLLAEIAALRDELAQTKNSLAAAQDEMTNTAQRLELAKQSTADEISELREQVAECEIQLKAAHAAAAAQEPLLEELTQDRDRLCGLVEEAERTLAERDEDLRQRSWNVEAAERAIEEVQVVAGFESRRLHAERDLRIAAEQHVQQLLLDLEALTKDRRLELTEDGLAALMGRRGDILALELAAARKDRDEIEAERELLAARILKWMTPGQYLEHALAANYDMSRDPLVRLKREEIRVESRYYAWQEANGKPKRARKFDPEQTIDEQAWAGAVSLRWRLMDRPHRRNKNPPKWQILGIRLDEVTEETAMAQTQTRVKYMIRKMEGG